MNLIDLLGARSGIVCAVGAGGKKTTLYRLAALHPGRVAVTASVFAVPPSRRVVDTRVFEPPGTLEDTVRDAARAHRRVAYAHPSEKSGRIAGVEPERIARLHRACGFEVTLVKADGARMRGIKAPADDEPRLVPGTAAVLHLTSAAVLGQPLDERVAHRPDRLAGLVGLAIGETITPVHLARLIAAPEGAWRGVGAARLIPVINQVDDADRLTGARAAARLALQACPRIDAVVLAAMRRDDPVVEIIRDGRSG